MNLALISVAIGSLLHLGQAGLLYYFLSIDTYVLYKAMLNTMNVAAPFLCLGFDSASPVLKKMFPNSLFFWNLIAFNVIVFFLFGLVSIMLPQHSSMKPLALGLCASTTVACTLIIANHYRVEGNLRKYFLNINIVDRLFRFTTIIFFAYFIRDILLWAFLVTAVSFCYVIYSVNQTKTTPYFNKKIFFKQFQMSLPFLFSSLVIITTTRLPFYVSYLTNEKLMTAKIDIWLMFTLFLLIPVLNKSKIEEANSQGDMTKYIMGMKDSWLKLMQQEFLVCSGIIVVGIIAVLMQLILPIDLVLIILPLLIGMLIITSIPNYVQLMCFNGGAHKVALISTIVFFSTSMCYAPRLVNDKIPVQILFIFSSIIYCIIGLGVAKYLKIKIIDFWSLRNTIMLAIFTIACISFASFLLMAFIV
jgi:hypothetical protein